MSEIDGADPKEAASLAQVIVDLVSTLVPAADSQQLRDQLPESEDDENWRTLFAAIDAGGSHEAEEAGADPSGAGGGRPGRPRSPR